MAFELFKDIGTLLSTVKKGARLAKQFGMLDSEDEKGQSKGFMGPDFNFDSRLQSARLNMQTMDAPREWLFLVWMLRIPTLRTTWQKKRTSARFNRLIYQPLDREVGPFSWVA